MQGDLISRSALIEKFNDTGIQITFDLPVEEVLGENVDIEDFVMLVQDAIQSYKNMVIATIKEQPTAYDVEKVCEQLEKNGQKMSEAKAIRPFAKHYPSDHRYYKAISVKKAVDIVRNGGKE